MNLLAYRVIILMMALLSTCAEQPAIQWEMKKLHDTYCPDGADERACTVVDLQYPQFSGHVADSLNRLILNTLCLNLADESPCPDIASIAEYFINDFKAFQLDMPGNHAGWELNQSINILHETPNVLAMAHKFYVYTGGAHGMPGEYFINIEKKSGRLFMLDDIIKNENRNDMLVIAKLQFYRQRDIPSTQTLGDAGYWFENQQFYLPDNFCITDDGLLFLYNPYDIAPYADGMIELFIPYSDVTSLLKMEKLK